MSCFDKWLNRLTAGSQLVLVVIALLTIKLTVIPLYQKELNSEELAKAQIKLNSVQDATDALSRQVSDKEMQLNSATAKLQSTEKAALESRMALDDLNSEFLSKSRDLAALKVQNAKILTESSALRTRVVLDNQLKFKQSLEWFSMIATAGDCYYPGLSVFTQSTDERKDKKEKGCGPYFSLKRGISDLRKTQRDSSGDPLDIQKEIIERWLTVADQAVEKNKVRLKSRFDISVFKSLDSENLTKKDGEDEKSYAKRIQDMDRAKEEYSSKTLSDDQDIEKDMIRNLDLQSG